MHAQWPPESEEKIGPGTRTMLVQTSIMIVATGTCKSRAQTISGLSCLRGICYLRW